MWFGFELAIGIYAAMIGGIYAFQRSLMYYPVKTIASPDVYGLAGVKETSLTSFDGTELQAWVHPASSGWPTILYFHGNAEHLGSRAAKFSAFIDAGFGLIAVSYRGFGKSDGSPSEAGIYGDARAAVDFALHTLRVPHHELIYYGESLGSGVAVQMASERTPGLLALEAAYTSVETRSAELYPFIVGARHLVIDKYDSLAKIGKIKTPLLMLHGEKDATIPVRMGRELFAAAHEPKTLVVYPNVYHADFSNEQILTPLLAEVRKYKLIKPAKH